MEFNSTTDHHYWKSGKFFKNSSNINKQIIFLTYRFIFQRKTVDKKIHNRGAKWPKQSHVASSDAITTGRTLVLLYSTSVENDEERYKWIRFIKVYQTPPKYIDLNRTINQIARELVYNDPSLTFLGKAEDTPPNSLINIKNMLDAQAQENWS